MGAMADHEIRARVNHRMRKPCLLFGLPAVVLPRVRETDDKRAGIGLPKSSNLLGCRGFRPEVHARVVLPGVEVIPACEDSLKKLGLG